MRTQNTQKHIVMIATLLLAFSLRCMAASPEAEAGFVADTKAAFDAKDAAKLENLVCWDGVTPKMKPMVIQELSGLVQRPIATVELVTTDPISDYGTRDGVTYKPNLAVIKKLKITFKSDKPPEADFFIGEKDGKLLITNAEPAK